MVLREEPHSHHKPQIRQLQYRRHCIDFLALPECWLGPGIEPPRANSSAFASFVLLLFHHFGSQNQKLIFKNGVKMWEREENKPQAEFTRVQVDIARA